MSARGRIVAACAFAALHLALLGPTLGDESPILDRGFGPQSERILDGDRPYGDIGFEYPPGALAPVVAPAVVSSGAHDYRVAFEAQMLAIDIAIVLLIALGPGLGRGRERCVVLGALSAYTIGILALSGLGPLPDSAIDRAPLALARFDLLPAGLLLAAVIARKARRAAGWGSLLSAGVLVKAFPVIALPALLRDEHRPRRALLATALPLAAAAILLLAIGDDPFGAITYHTGRDLQIESLGATPLLIGQLLGADARVVVGNGSFNIDAPAADAIKALSLAALIAIVVGLVVAGQRTRPPLGELLTAILAAAIALAPVLSPQFLLWVLPIAAATYGFRLPGLLLLAALLATQVMLASYAGVAGLEPGFIWSATARNALLVGFAASVTVPILRRAYRVYPAIR